MMEIALSVVFANFMKVVHVQLHRMGKYLSDEWGVVAMFEVFGQDISREIVLVDDDKADSIGSPSYCTMVLFILNGMDSTPRSS